MLTADSLLYGGTAVIAYLAEPSSMNEFVAFDINSEELQNFVLFTTLIRYDENLEPVPHLAKSWETSREGNTMTLTFHLHEDVRWHDGALTTADDVKFTFDRIKDPATAYPHAARFSLYDSAAVADSFTIAFYLKPHPGFMDPWRSVAIMPAHLLGAVAPKELASHPFGTRSPVGNGPFSFVEHRSGDRWIFEANLDFPESLGGRPHLDRLVYRVITEPTTRLAEFLTGDLDVYLAVDPAHVDRMAGSANGRVISYPSRAYSFVGWNGQKTLLEDAIVRRALTLAIDRRQIVEAVRYGLGEVAVGPVPPFHWAHDGELEPLPYDPDSAAALLDLAGWVDRDGDGIRERNGLKASIELKTNAAPVREDIVTMIQADLTKVGLEVSIRIVEAQSLGADVTSPERRFDAFVLGWQSDFWPDDRVLFGCDSPPGPYQWASYCNRRVVELLNQIAITEDRSEALPLWQLYQRIIHRDQPYTFIYYEVVSHAVRDRIHDVMPDIRGWLINVTEWWIAPSDRRR